jgi:hypothetical protein
MKAGISPTELAEHGRPESFSALGPKGLPNFTRSRVLWAADEPVDLPELGPTLNPPKPRETGSSDGHTQLIGET